MITENVRSFVPSPEQVRSETRQFIADLMLCDDFLAVPITAEDAAYDMSNWYADGVEYPSGMTPEVYAETWNEMIMEV